VNRFREDIPYKFSPPKYSRFWAPVIQWVSDRFYLAGTHRVAEVTIRGGTKVAELARASSSMLITPNHSDHSDPHVLMYWARRERVPLHFVATKEIFLRNRGLNGKILQRAGVFSIDREGADLKAIKEAMRIVQDGEYPLVMFPEGEIYHLNGRITPLNDGAATIMLRTAKKLAKDAPERQVAIVPTAMRYGYIDDISATFADAMDRLESYILWKPRRDLSVVERIYKFGEALLSLKELEYLGRIQEGDLTARLAAFNKALIGEPEKRYLGRESDDPVPERIRRIRGRIRAILLADEPPEPDVLRQCHDDLDRIYLAIQLFSYPGEYIREKASMDRIAETILKFEEDLFGELRIKGRRRAEIVFCDPIDVRACLDDYATDAKGTVHSLTSRIEQAIGDALA